MFMALDWKSAVSFHQSLINDQTYRTTEIKMSKIALFTLASKKKGK